MRTSSASALTKKETSKYTYSDTTDGLLADPDKRAISRSIS